MGFEQRKKEQDRLKAIAVAKRNAELKAAMAKSAEKSKAFAQKVAFIGNVAKYKAEKLNGKFGEGVNAMRNMDAHQIKHKISFSKENITGMMMDGKKMVKKAARKGVSRAIKNAVEGAKLSKNIGGVAATNLGGFAEKFAKKSSQLVQYRPFTALLYVLCMNKLGLKCLPVKERKRRIKRLKLIQKHATAQRIGAICRGWVSRVRMRLAGKETNFMHRQKDNLHRPAAPYLIPLGRVVHTSTPTISTSRKQLSSGNLLRLTFLD